MENLEQTVGRRNPDALADPCSKTFNLSWRKRIALAGGGFCSVLALAAAPVYDYFDKTGDVDVSCSSPELPKVWNSDPNFATLNVQKKFLPEEINRLINENNLLAIGLQEVPRKDIARYIEEMPDMCFISVVADSKDIDDGGQTNLIISRTVPSDIDSHVLEHTSFWPGLLDVMQGFGKDFLASGRGLVEKAEAKVSIPNARDAVPENRVIFSAVFLVEENKGRHIGDEPVFLGAQKKPIEVRFSTGHLTFQEEDQEQQQDEVVEYVKNTDIENQAVCLDWNEDLKRVRTLLSGLGYITLNDGPTSDSGRSIDHCSFKWKGSLTGSHLKVVPQPEPDHDAVVLSLVPHRQKVKKVVK